MVSSTGSIWNFHSWIEVWLLRADLDGNYAVASWNAADSTPQEQSDGKMQMGPTSVKAVKDMRDDIN